MTYKEAFNKLTDTILPLFESGEAKAISRMVFEDILHISYKTILTNNSILSDEHLDLINITTKRLLNNEPIQYITGMAHFYNHVFNVNTNVLIPRPETEELVYNTLNDIRDKIALNIIDIGTGSGCIAITLKKNTPQHIVHACDISSGALEIAKRNAIALDADVTFDEMDILNPMNNTYYDVIISNPPYIKPSEASTLLKNVIEHEPHTALFAPEEDGLTFYKAIATFCNNYLNPNGLIYLELNPLTADAVKVLFETQGYRSRLLADMQGKTRFLKCLKIPN